MSYPSRVQNNARELVSLKQRLDVRCPSGVELDSQGK